MSSGYGYGQPIVWLVLGMAGFLFLLGLLCGLETGWLLWGDRA